MGYSSNTIEESTIGDIPKPPTDLCNCGLPTTIQMVHISDNRGREMEVPFSEVAYSKAVKDDSNNTTRTNWASTKFKKNGYQFIDWLNYCNACWYGKKPSSGIQASKESSQAYSIINKLLAPELMGKLSKEIGADKIQWAKDYVKWHWPQNSTETMPEDVRAVVGI